MILVTACFPMETRWIATRPGVRVVRTAVWARSRVTMDAHGAEASRASSLLAVGFCGGIDPRMQRGDLVLARAIRHRDRDLHADPRLLELARRALSDGPDALHVGVFESVDRVLSPEEKRELAHRDVAAVEMESGPLARWAAEREIPFLALRVVLDPVDVDVPFPVDRPIWLSSLLHPLAAARLAVHAIDAGRVLGQAAGAVTAAFAGGPHA